MLSVLSMPQTPTYLPVTALPAERRITDGPHSGFGRKQYRTECKRWPLENSPEVGEMKAKLRLWQRRRVGERKKMPFLVLRTQPVPAEKLARSKRQSARPATLPARGAASKDISCSTRWPPVDACRVLDSSCIAELTASQSGATKPTATALPLNNASAPAMPLITAPNAPPPSRHGASTAEHWAGLLLASTRDLRAAYATIQAPPPPPAELLPNVCSVPGVDGAYDGDLALAVERAVRATVGQDF
ncbi:hypothetical protein NKR23_g3527 [Pleurostoma richardsiae]|uniref:Uncharacterized protein n=1 Tax=Pleurostoma richardsiae TaxID=41990 RepID=A0AA38RZE1_9PEZI|nr:hypothetical protein NKR23_g3527 [Pleurostoma richardsiae]